MDKKIAVIGATGVVGRVMVETLISENLITKDNLNNLILIASEKSAGSTLSVLGKEIPVLSAQEGLSRKPDYVIMSAGSGASKELAPLFSKQGATVIDNSSAWRMLPEISLIVPSISPWDPKKTSGIISNPNCVAIMIAIALAPFKDLNIDSITISAMQAVSGAGQRGLKALEEEGQKMDGIKSVVSPFVSNIAGNIIPASAPSAVNPEYSDEEFKAMTEVPKILGKDFKISVQSNRVPIPHGHSANIRIYFNEIYQKGELLKLINNIPQILYSEKPLGPYDTVGKNYVIIRSFRQDLHNPKVYEFFVTSDNLRVGAAFNAVAILEVLMGRPNNNYGKD